MTPSRSLLSVVASVLLVASCEPASSPSAPMNAPAPARAAATPPSSPIVDGELETATEVVFEVRPLNGPGTMGPTVLSAKSEGALEEVRAYLAAHPEAAPLRIDYGINPMRMSSSPDAKWPAGLALQVARWLVEHGIACGRLEAVGWLDPDLEPPAQRVRFFVEGKGRERPANKQARLDVCASLK